jgi:hypothetical protein
MMEQRYKKGDRDWKWLVRRVIWILSCQSVVNQLLLNEKLEHDGSMGCHSIVIRLWRMRILRNFKLKRSYLIVIGNFSLNLNLEFDI